MANSPDKLFVTNDDVWADINISIQCKSEGEEEGGEVNETKAAENLHSCENPRDTRYCVRIARAPEYMTNNK